MTKAIIFGREFDEKTKSLQNITETLPTKLWIEKQQTGIDPAYHFTQTRDHKDEKMTDFIEDDIDAQLPILIDNTEDLGIIDLEDDDVFDNIDDDKLPFLKNTYSKKNRPNNSKSVAAGSKSKANRIDFGREDVGPELSSKDSSPRIDEEAKEIHPGHTESPEIISDSQEEPETDLQHREEIEKSPKDIISPIVEEHNDSLKLVDQENTHQKVDTEKDIQPSELPNEENKQEEFYPESDKNIHHSQEEDQESNEGDEGEGESDEENIDQYLDYQDDADSDQEFDTQLPISEQDIHIKVTQEEEIKEKINEGNQKEPDIKDKEVIADSQKDDAAVVLSQDKPKEIEEFDI